MIGWVVSLFKHPMATLATLGLGIIGILSILVGRKNREIGRKDSELDMQSEVIKQRAEAERMDQEEIKKQRVRSTDHETNIRNGGSPFRND